MTNDHDYLSTLRKRGYRITPQREMIIKTITRNGSHFTADELYSELQKQTQSLNIATVYRTLEMLVEEGLVSRSDFGQGHVIFAPEGHGPHIHLVCRLCGDVIDADITLAETMKNGLQDRYQFKLDLHHLSVFGVCSQCQKGEDNHDSQ